MQVILFIVSHNVFLPWIWLAQFLIRILASILTCVISPKFSTDGHVGTTGSVGYMYSSFLPGNGWMKEDDFDILPPLDLKDSTWNIKL